MKGTDAREVLNMTKAATTPFPLDDDQVQFWLGALAPLDAKVATQAVLLGTKSWKRFPSWAEFYDAYASIRNDAERKVKAHVQHEEWQRDGRRGYAPPEWVLVWSWTRFHRVPREMRSLPQQGDWGDPDNRMSMQEYDNLLQEWEAAGRPKTKDPIPVAFREPVG